MDPEKQRRIARMGGKAAFDKAYSRTGSFADPAFVKAGEKLKELIDLQPFQKGFLAATYNDEASLVAHLSTPERSLERRRIVPWLSTSPCTS